MPVVPKAFSELKDEEIEEWGFLGISENVVFNMLQMTGKQRDYATKTDRWIKNYNKGLARREIELAKMLQTTKDSSILKEVIKSTSLVDKKLIDENAEFTIDAPQWMKPKLAKGKKGQRAKISSERGSVQPEVPADVS